MREWSKQQEDRVKMETERLELEKKLAERADAQFQYMREARNRWIDLSFRKLELELEEWRTYYDRNPTKDDGINAWVGKEREGNC